MSVIVHATGEDSLERARKMLNGIEGGFTKAVRNAMNRATQRLRSKTAKAVRERYAISAANVRANENVSVTYSYSNGVQATVSFHGNKIPLFRFDGARPTGPSPDASRLIPAVVHGDTKGVHPGTPAYGHVLKSTGAYIFPHAFVASMSSGHTGIFARNGGKTKAGGDAISEIMGLSVPQMIGSEEVAEKLAKEAMESFDKDLDHNVMAILAGIF